MCGIAGISKFDGSVVDLSELSTLTHALAHRGPDDIGYLGYRPGAPAVVSRKLNNLNNAVTGLVHLRLSILDLTPAGFQPMGTPDGRFWIIFNGEIYNYLELRRELQALGHTFRTQTDTEVLLAGLAQWGKAALKRLVGMFAFALLDTREHLLLLARDCFGIKPLYYCWTDRQFAFASELKALLRLPNSPRQIQPQRLFEYLRFGLTDHGGHTLLQDYHQIPAAHFLEISLDRPCPAEPTRYWEVDLTGGESLPFDEAAKQLQSLFLKNVELHLRSDVPVGACLSGGIDSSAIVLSMRHLMGSRLDLHTFTYVADEDDISEEKWAVMAGRAAGATMHTIKPKAGELLEDLQRIIALQDEPFASTSIYAQYKVFQLVHNRRVKVVLDGQGADELLGGYANYQGARFASLVHQGQWLSAWRFWRAASVNPHGRRLLFYAGEFLVPPPLQAPFRRWLGKDLVPGWLNRDWFAKCGISLVPPRRPKLEFRKELEESTKVNLLSLLRYEDRNSMAFSIESRVPFLTPEIVQFILRLPEEFVIAADGTSKAVFREAMRGLVPDPILNRRDKIGFATPELNWLSTLGPWVQSTFQSDTARQIPALHATQLAETWQSSLGEPRRFGWHFWRCLNLIKWCQLYDVQF